MKPDDELPWWCISQGWMRVIQVLIFAVVGFTSIYFEQSTGYHINPMIIGAWAFMASYGFTLAYVNLSTRYVRTGRILPRLGRKKRPDPSL